MKKILTTILALALASTAAAAIAQDQTAPVTAPESTATSLDDLLEQVRSGARYQTQQHREREAEFIGRRDRQQQLLREATQTKANEERRSVRLEAEFEKNKIEIARLDQALRVRMGNLSELFGVLQQVAGDARGNFATSIISTQLPDRGAALDTLIEKAAAATQLPSLAEIEALWIGLQEEMTQSGKIARFSFEVKTPEGLGESVDLIRIGAFNLVANGKYYNYFPGTGNVEELARQPSGRFTSTIESLEAANAGELVAFAFDPSRGQLLATLIRAPSNYERWLLGGTVGFVITGLGAIGVLLVIWKAFSLFAISSKVKRQIKQGASNPNNPLGRVLQVYESNKNVDVETLELKLDEAILKETPAIESFLTIIKIISAVAPLFGLLGTVTGMIVTFQAIVLFGTGDPTVMANGISQALVTTVLGLVVAIPTLLFHSILASMSKQVIHILEEQSAGIIAVHAEKEGANA